jgi:hypothetical protein
MHAAACTCMHAASMHPAGTSAAAALLLLCIGQRAETRAAGPSSHRSAQVTTEMGRQATADPIAAPFGCAETLDGVSEEANQSVDHLTVVVAVLGGGDREFAQMRRQATRQSCHIAYTPNRAFTAALPDMAIS